MLPFGYMLCIFKDHPWNIKCYYTSFLLVIPMIVAWFSWLALIVNLAQNLTEELQLSNSLNRISVEKSWGSSWLLIDTNQDWRAQTIVGGIVLSQVFLLCIRKLLKDEPVSQQWGIWNSSRFLLQSPPVVSSLMSTKVEWNKLAVPASYSWLITLLQLPSGCDLEVSDKISPLCPKMILLRMFSSLKTTKNQLYVNFFCKLLIMTVVHAISRNSDVRMY